MDALSETGSLIGAALRRREDAALLTGAGRFVDDRAPPGCLHLAFLRSPYARGRLVSLEVEAAAALPRVAGVFTAADLQGLGRLAVNPVIGEVRPPRFPLLAGQEVMAVGEPIAAVAAETPAAALDALEAIAFEIEPLEPLLTPRAALAGETLFPEVPGNLALERRWRGGEPEAAFASAAVVVEARVRHPRVAPTSLEPRATLAAWDATEERLTLWSSTQTPHRLRGDMATILGLDPARVRAIAPDVGGAFGLKASLYPEDVVAAFAARALGRPVKWIAGRGEELLAATHARGAESFGRLALDAEGRMLALQAEFLFPLGHWMPFSGAVPPWNAARILPGPYRVEHLEILTRGVVTNTAPVGIYRGAGRPEAAMLMERLAEAAARALDLDPFELRRRNLLPSTALPHATATGTRLDSGDYPAALALLESSSGYAALRREVERRRGGGETLGLGLCCYVEPSGQGWESATVTLEADGGLCAATGSSAQGQGRETAYAQIAAEVFRVAPERVRVLHGDTDTAPAGIGAVASRSTSIGGSALLLAARRTLDLARARAGALLGVAAESLEPGPEGLRQPGGPAIAWEELARSVNEPLSSALVYEVEGEAWGFGCCLALVSLDAETGSPRVERLFYVDDAGTLVNPLLAEGQIQGGIAQGLGEALLERIVYSEDGQLLTGSLLDYALPRAADMPALRLQGRCTPSPCNPLGAKGLGETGTIGVPPAVLNAALDALRPLGVTELDLPLTSESLWRATRERKA